LTEKKAIGDAYSQLTNDRYESSISFYYIS